MRRSHFFAFIAWLSAVLAATLSILAGIFGDELKIKLLAYMHGLDRMHFALIATAVVLLIISLATIYAVLTRNKEIRSLSLRNLELVKQLQIDTRSGLASYDFLKRKFDDEYVPAARKGSVFSVLMIDIVRFKDINDKFGHNVGDEAISLIGGFLKGFVRDKRDMAARFGEAADEFFFIISGDAGALTGFSSRLRRDLKHESTEGFELLKVHKVVLSFWSSGTIVMSEDNWDAIKDRLMHGLTLAKQSSPESIVIVAPSQDKQPSVS